MKNADTQRSKLKMGMCQVALITKNYRLQLILIAIILQVLQQNSANAQSIADRRNQAMQLYKKGSYIEAAAIYTSMLQSGKLKNIAERSGRLQDGKHGLEELRREGYM